MRVSIAVYAPLGERFGPDAFDSSIGTEVNFIGHRSRLVAADVHESGDVAVITLELIDTEPIKLPEAGLTVNGSNTTRRQP